MLSFPTFTIEDTCKPAGTSISSDENGANVVGIHHQRVQLRLNTMFFQILSRVTLNALENGFELQSTSCQILFSTNASSPDNVKWILQVFSSAILIDSLQCSTLWPSFPSPQPFLCERLTSRTAFSGVLWFWCVLRSGTHETHLCAPKCKGCIPSHSVQNIIDHQIHEALSCSIGVSITSNSSSRKLATNIFLKTGYISIFGFVHSCSQTTLHCFRPSTISSKLVIASSLTWIA